MAAFKNIVTEVSVVAVGHFNPTILNPDWLLRHELINDADSKEADIEVIHPEVCRFQLPWCHLEVLTNRFIVRTDKAGYFPVLHDLAIGILSILSETPIDGLGINLTYSDTTNDQNLTHKIGHTLAPKGPWAKILPNSPSHGLSQLTIQSPRSSLLPGYTSTRIRPITHGKDFGIEMLINNHYEVKSFDKDGLSLSIPELIKAEWDEAIKNAEVIHDGILSLAKDTD